MEDLHKKLDAAKSEKASTEKKIVEMRQRVQKLLETQQQQAALLDSAYDRVERTCGLRRTELCNALDVEEHLDAAKTRRPEVMLRLDQNSVYEARKLEERYNQGGEVQVCCSCHSCLISLSHGWQSSLDISAQQLIEC